MTDLQFELSSFLYLYLAPEREKEKKVFGLIKGSMFCK